MRRILPALLLTLLSAQSLPAEQWLKKAGLTPEESKTTIVHLDAKQRDALFKDFVQREALFREFAAYQKERRQTIVAYDNQ